MVLGHGQQSSYARPSFQALNSGHSLDDILGENGGTSPVPLASTNEINSVLPGGWATALRGAEQSRFGSSVQATVAPPLVPNPPPVPSRIPTYLQPNRSLFGFDPSAHRAAVHQRGIASDFRQRVPPFTFEQTRRTQALDSEFGPDQFVDGNSLGIGTQTAAGNVTRAVLFPGRDVCSVG
jgi:hypothetical protein